jgi:hypothetical protein
MLAAQWAVEAPEPDTWRTQELDVQRHTGTAPRILTAVLALLLVASFLVLYTG